MPQTIAPPAWGTRRNKLRTLLEDRAGTLPEVVDYGAASKYASILMCSRERIRQLLGDLGVAIGDRQTVVKTCDHTECMTEVNPYSVTGFCADHRYLDAYMALQCTSCGQSFRRLKSRVAVYNKRGVARGRTGPVCKKTCIKPQEISNCAYCGKASTPVSKARAEIRKLAFHAECKPKAHLLIPPFYWSRVEDKHLPMVEHMEELLRLRRGKQ